jgi:hypothetical protein
MGIILIIMMLWCRTYYDFYFAMGIMLIIMMLLMDYFFTIPTTPIMLIIMIIVMMSRLIMTTSLLQVERTARASMHNYYHYGWFQSKSNNPFFKAYCYVPRTGPNEGTLNPALFVPAALLGD